MSSTSVNIGGITSSDKKVDVINPPITAKALPSSRHFPCSKRSKSVGFPLHRGNRWAHRRKRLNSGATTRWIPSDGQRANAGDGVVPLINKLLNGFRCFRGALRLVARPLNETAFSEVVVVLSAVNNIPPPEQRPQIRLNIMLAGKASTNLRSVVITFRRGGPLDMNVRVVFVNVCLTHSRALALLLRPDQRACEAA